HVATAYETGHFGFLLLVPFQGVMNSTQVTVARTCTVTYSLPSTPRNVGRSPDSAKRDTAPPSMSAKSATTTRASAAVMSALRRAAVWSASPRSAGIVPSATSSIVPLIAPGLCAVMGADSSTSATRGNGSSGVTASGSQVAFAPASV